MLPSDSYIGNNRFVLEQCWIIERRNFNNMPSTTGENEYWVKQGNDVVVENCQPETLAALYDLSKWFYENSGGHPLVVTAGTNGSSHEDGEYSHYNGWKLDVNDYGGGYEYGYLIAFGTNYLSGTLADAFVEYGHSIGLGMNREKEGTDAVHFDIQCGQGGYEWSTKQSYGGYNNPNGTGDGVGVSTKPKWYDEIKEMAANSKSSLEAQAAEVGTTPKVYLHWTAGRYNQTFNSYHINITGDGEITPTGNFDEVKKHTHKRNSGSIGIALCCAYDATTNNNLGSEPPTSEQITTMAQCIAAICEGLGLSIEKNNVMTHGEAAANEDGLHPHEKYAVWDDETSDGDTRWDLEYLAIPESPIYNPTATDGTRGGDVLRKMAIQYSKTGVIGSGSIRRGNNASNNRVRSGSNSHQHDFTAKNETVYITPRNKTYCEPVYPDLIYVQGNIPNSAIGDKAANNVDKLIPVKGLPNDPSNEEKDNSAQNSDSENNNTENAEKKGVQNG